MALPSKLKNMNVFNNGASYLGEVTSVTLPKLTRKMEDYRAGGMLAPVAIDHGLEKLEIEVKCGGIMRDAIGQFGATQVDAVLLRFAGAYQRDSTGEVDAVEVTMRGRWSEVDMGDAKPGEDTEHTLKCALSYYQLSINGAEVVLVDIINMIERYNGVDVAAAQRNALGGLSGDIGGLVPGAV
jgi:P2 family phage contractile tail tube protein